MKTPKWEETEEITPTWDETEEVQSEEPVSQLESAARGAAQGLTFEMADELLGAGKAAYDIATDKPELKDFAELYKKYRDIERKQFEKAKEDNPITYGASDIGAGILPALLSGGATAAANIGKVGLKEAAKAAAKTGAKFGGATALGMTEDITDVGQTAKDVAMGAGLGAATGVAIPAAGKALGRGASKVAEGSKDFVENITSSIPLIQEGLDAFKLASKGQSVLGKDNYNKIIKESKELVKEKLKPLMVSEKEKFSKAIGKIYKKIETIGTTKDISQELNSIQKQIDNLASSGKVPTEEGLKVLRDLTNTINRFKKDVIKVVPTKKVNTGVETALGNLNKKINKLKAINEEVNERVNFTEPKVDLDKGIVSTYETTTGKVITEPIKTGEFTPIKIEKTPDFQNYDINKLKNLKDASGELFDIAKQGSGLGVVQKPIAKTKAMATKAINELAEESELGSALDIANKGFSNIRQLDDILPTSLLNGDDLSMNKLSQFFRKAEIEGMSGDDLRDRLITFSSKLKESNPKFADEFLKNVENIAKRYELAQTARESFGLNLGTAKAISVIGGSVAGSSTRPISKVVQKSTKTLNKLTDSSLNSVKSKFLNSENKALRAIGNNIQTAMQSEGPLKNALLWSISQQPAVRRAIEDFYKEEEETPSFEETTQLENTREPQSELPSALLEKAKPQEPKQENEIELEEEEEKQQEIIPINKEEVYSFEGEGDKTGADDSTGFMGVTDMARSEVGRLEEYKRAKTNKERRMIDEQVAEEFYAKLQKMMPDHWRNIPNEYKPTFLDAAYNLGTSIFKYKNLNSALKRGDYLEAARQTLDTANIDGKTSKGIAKRRAEQYNKIASKLKSPTIKQVEQKPSGEIIYRGDENDILRYGEERGIHPKSKPEIIQIKDTLNKIMKMKSSGMETPEYEIEKAFDGINQMDIPEEDKLALQDEVVQIESFSDVERIKQLLDKYRTS